MKLVGYVYISVSRTFHARERRMQTSLVTAMDVAVGGCERKATPFRGRHYRSPLYLITCLLRGVLKGRHDNSNDQIYTVLCSYH